jgi:hypothetical protein
METGRHLQTQARHSSEFFCIRGFSSAHSHLENPTTHKHLLFTYYYYYQYVSSPIMGPSQKHISDAMLRDGYVTELSAY